jgi:hypothetical protein
MELGEVLGVLADLTEAGCSVWVAGGWGVDALVGRQTRLHRDLDLALDGRDETVALRVLQRRATAWRLIGDRSVLSAAAGSTFTRWFSMRRATAAKPALAAESSNIRQRRSFGALLAVWAYRACPAISSCAFIPATSLALSTCLISPSLNASARAFETRAF